MGFYFEPGRWDRRRPTASLPPCGLCSSGLWSHQLNECSSSLSPADTHKLREEARGVPRAPWMGSARGWGCLVRAAGADLGPELEARNLCSWNDYDWVSPKHILQNDLGFSLF